MEDFHWYNYLGILEFNTSSLKKCLYSGLLLKSFVFNIVEAVNTLSIMAGTQAHNPLKDIIQIRHKQPILEIFGGIFIVKEPQSYC